MTSAPRSPRISHAYGAATLWPSSMTVRPISGNALGIIVARMSVARCGSSRISRSASRLCATRRSSGLQAYPSSFLRRPSSGFRKKGGERRMGLLPHHDGAFVLDYYHAVLVDAAGANLHHALARPRVRLAHANHLGFRIKRISWEDRMGQLDV